MKNTGSTQAALSDALIGTFLPKRRAFLLDTWLCDENQSTGCQTDDDCDDGLICVEGECVEDTSSTGCETDEDCPSGFNCVDGECVEDTSSTGCSTDADCPSGFSCIDGECVEDSSSGCVNMTVNPVSNAFTVSVLIV